MFFKTHFRALLKICCLEMPADFRGRKTSIFLSEKKRKTGMLSCSEAFCRFYGRKGVWQIRNLRFLEVPFK